MRLKPQTRVCLTDRFQGHAKNADETTCLFQNPRQKGRRDFVGLRSRPLDLHPNIFFLQTNFATPGSFFAVFKVERGAPQRNLGPSFDAILDPSKLLRSAGSCPPHTGQPRFGSS